MKYFLVFSVYVCFPLLVSGQHLIISFKETFGSFQMNGLSGLQNKMAQHSPAKVLQSFPNYYGSQITLVTGLKNNTNIGIFWDYTSTGGRMDYQDYSGKLRTDQIVFRNALGVRYEEEPLAFNQLLSLTGGLQVSGLFSRLIIEEYIQVFNEHHSQKTKMKALGIGVEPDISLQLTKYNLLCRLGVGYQISFSKPFHLEGNKNAVLIHNNDEVGPEWHGFRLGVTLGYLLPIK